MADKIPQPTVNDIIETDPQIIKVDLEYTDWGSTKAGMPGNIKNGNVIKHVGGGK
jgi:hypothetical protein